MVKFSGKGQEGVKGMSSDSTSQLWMCSGMRDYHRNVHSPVSCQYDKQYFPFVFLTLKKRLKRVLGNECDYLRW